MRSLRLLALLGALVVTLAACGGGVSQAPPAPGGEPGDGVDRSRLARELNLYTWGDYFNPAVLEAFEAAYGVSVSMETYASSEEFSRGFTAAVLTGAGLAVLGALAGTFIPRKG